MVKLRLFLDIKHIMFFCKTTFNHMKHLQQPYFHSLHLLCLMQRAKLKYSAFSLLEPLFPARFKQRMYILRKSIQLPCGLLVSARAGKKTATKMTINFSSKWFRSNRCIDNTVYCSSDK